MDDRAMEITEAIIAEAYNESAAAAAACDKEQTVWTAWTETGDKAEQDKAPEPVSPAASSNPDEIDKDVKRISWSNAVTAPLQNANSSSKDVPNNVENLFWLVQPMIGKVATEKENSPTIWETLSYLNTVWDADTTVQNETCAKAERPNRTVAKSKSMAATPSTL